MNLLTGSAHPFGEGNCSRKKKNNVIDVVSIVDCDEKLCFPDLLKVGLHLLDDKSISLE